MIVFPSAHFSRLCAAMQKEVTKFDVNESSKLEDILSKFPQMFPTKESYLDYLTDYREILNGHTIFDIDNMGKAHPHYYMGVVEFNRMCKKQMQATWRKIEIHETIEVFGPESNEPLPFTDKIEDFEFCEECIPVQAQHQHWLSRTRKLVTFFILIRTAARLWRREINEANRIAKVV
jgi:hypothetical protein